MSSVVARLAGCIAAALVCSGGAVALVDENENCAGWASAGECTANPGYMSQSCQRSCAEVEASRAVADSFYDLSAQDVDGRWIDFASYFENRVVLITNVASE
mmetsp:Transcript_15130/g.31728  ORF Transcript_15130/g.31728 Transcript_15130/m.31728 type:complete len:102 (+) Transcript_15130:173-478(+)